MHVDRRTYWKKQIRRTLVLLSIWAIVGFGMSILFVEELNQIQIGGMPLGFWMAQQGSIYVFILLILAYAIMSGRADRAAGLDDGGAGPVSRPGSSASTGGPSGTISPDHTRSA